MTGFGTFYGRATFEPISLLILFITVHLAFLLPRRKALVPLVFLICFTPYSQRLVVLGLDLTFLRIAILTGWTRLVIAGEWTGFRWCKLDLFVLLYGAVSCLTYVSLLGSPEALIRSAGFLVDSLGMYFLARHIVRNWDDLETLAWAFAFFLLPVAVLMLIERITGENPFALLFSELPLNSRVREGVVRSKGAFPHPIHAGIFGAAVWPIVATCRLEAGRSWSWTMQVIGAASSLAIVVCAASSTAIFTLGFGLIAFSAFRLRKHVLPIACLVGVSVCAMHMASSEPIWRGYSSLSIVPGSTGDFRFRLVDQAISRFDSWWLIGTRDTSVWGKGLNDLTNQFVLEGVSGGLLRLACFMATLFSGLGALAGRFVDEDCPPGHARAYWGLWVALFMFLVSFNGVSMFGQSVQLYYLFLAMAGSLTLPARCVRPQLHSLAQQRALGSAA